MVGVLYDDLSDQVFVDEESDMVLPPVTINNRKVLFRCAVSHEANTAEKHDQLFV